MRDFSLKSTRGNKLCGCRSEYTIRNASHLPPHLSAMREKLMSRGKKWKKITSTNETCSCTRFDWFNERRRMASQIFPVEKYAKPVKENQGSHGRRIFQITSYCKKLQVASDEKVILSSTLKCYLTSNRVKTQI